MRSPFLLMALCALFLSACSSCPDTKVAAAPPVKSQVYTPPCSGGNYDRPAGDEVYTPSNCNPWDTLVAQLEDVQCPFRGLGIPGLECRVPAASFVPEAPPAAAAPLPACGPLPADAKPGEVWCCTFVQPPAAAPVQTKVCDEQRIEIPIPATYKTVCEQVPDQPARVEWRAIKCPDSADECWQLVEVPATFKTIHRTVEATPASVRVEVIPAKFEMRASAPPPGYWEWQLRADCRPVAPAAAADCPPAGR